MHFNNEKCKVLQAKSNNPEHQHMLQAIYLESSLAEKGNRMGTKLKMTQKCFLVRKKKTLIVAQAVLGKVLSAGKRR